MISEQTTYSRADALNYLRLASTSAILYGNLPSHPFGGNPLDPAGLRAFDEVWATLSHILAGDWSTASVYLARAQAVAEEVNWPELAGVANSLKQAASLRLSGVNAERHPGDLASTIDDLEKAVGELDGLVAAAGSAGLRDIVHVAQTRLLDSLAELTKMVMRNRDWSATAHCRRRYLMQWSKNASPYYAVTSSDNRRPLSYFRKMGAIIGSIHSFNIVHGTLLLESFTSEPAIRNFKMMKFLDHPEFEAQLDEHISRLLEDQAKGRPLSIESISTIASAPVSHKSYGVDNPHVEAFAVDLESLWHQLSPDRREAFEQGYLSVSGYSASGQVLKLVAERTASETAVAVPFVPLRLPHFAVRAAGYALRHFAGSTQAVTLALDEILAIENVEVRLERLSDLIVESWHVVPQVYAAAIEQLQADIWRCLGERSAEATSVICENIAFVLKPFLSADNHQRVVACGLVARSEAAIDPDEIALYRSRAASEFIALYDNTRLGYACLLLDKAVSSATSPERLGQVAVQAMAGYVELATANKDQSLLKAALAVSAQIPPFFLSQEHAEMISAYEQYGYAMRPETSEVARQRLFRRASAICDRFPTLKELKTKILYQSAPVARQQEDGATETVEQLPLSSDARAYLAQGNWPAAASTLHHDLEVLEAKGAAPVSCLALAAKYSQILQNGSDYVPHKRGVMAKDLLEIVERYAPILLAENTRSDSHQRSRRVANQANSFGWAAVHFHPYMQERGEELLQHGVELLELAVKITPKETVPTSFSSYANNLALGYRAQASRTDLASRKQLLERGAGLMRQVAEIDERLSRSDDRIDREVGATAYLDYFNIGLICLDLARATYDATWISEKPKDSARWYKEAVDAFVTSRKLAQAVARPDNAGTASNNLALVYCDLCEHFLLERSWAGGDIQRAFYDWITTFSGGQVSTEDFLNKCAESALSEAMSASRAGIGSNPALLLESIESHLKLWSLFNQFPEFSPTVARHSLVTLLELLDETEDADSFTRDAKTAIELRGLHSVLQALFQVEMCQHLTQHGQDAQSAYEAFRSLSRKGDALARAIARPRLKWFALDQGNNDVTVNGLYLGGSVDGLELRIPSQRRRLRLSGLEMSEIGFAVRDVAFLRDSASMLVARIESSMTFGDLPPTILTAKAVGVLGGTRIAIEATRLPIASWDSWAIELDLEDRPLKAIRPSLPYIGRYDAVSGTMSPDFPATLEKTGQSLIFGEEGMTLEFTMPFMTSSSADFVHVGGTPAEPAIQLNTRAVVMVVKTTPRIASADVAFFVRGDRPEGAMCCAASFDLTSPSVSFPKPMMHAYGPLFFFEDEAPVEGVAAVNALNPHEIVLVGLPDEQADAGALVLALFDPRRDIVMLVDESEREKAERALGQVQHSIYSRIGGDVLLRAAAFRSSAAENQHFDPVANIQVVVTPREWIPTVTQMLLDFATIRRSSAEDIPIAAEGGITFLNIKGNPFAMRNATLFRGVVSLEEVVARYRGMRQKPLGTLVWKNPKASERILSVANPTVPQRPVFMIPSNPSTAIGAIPYMRHLGALPVPNTSEFSALIEGLNPLEVYVTEIDATKIPQGAWTQRIIPSDTSELTKSYHAYVQQDYQTTLGELAHTHPHLLSSRKLLEEMQPADYVVLCASSKEERPWAYLAANYAAAIHAPLLVSKIESATEPSKAIAQSRNPANESAKVRQDQSTRHLGWSGEGAILTPVPHYVSDAYDALIKTNPVYLGLVSSDAGFPIELMGNPPVATRFAVGRLSGPDLLSTSLLIMRAALGEDIERPATIKAVLVDCGKPLTAPFLPGVSGEIDAVHKSFERESEIRSQIISAALIPDDKSEFLRQFGDAHLVHFAGHGYYDAAHPESSGLVFREGLMTPKELIAVSTSAPMIFSNACETGLLGRPDRNQKQAWSGLAASFITCGAANYLGSLSEIFDESSSRFARTFYEGLLGGKTVGNALLDSKKQAYGLNDSIWEAYVMFGCPRNRLRAQARSKPDLSEGLL